MLPKYVKESDVFLDYPYPIYDGTNTKVWVPVDKRKDTPMSVGFKLWKKIITTYFQVMIETMLEGKIIDLPRGMGTLWIGKVKGRKRRYFKGGKKKVYHNVHTDGYYPQLVWNRDKTGRFRYKHIYVMNLTSRLRKMISRKLFDEPHTIYKLQDG